MGETIFLPDCLLVDHIAVQQQGCIIRKIGLIFLRGNILKIYNPYALSSIFVKIHSHNVSFILKE